MHKRIKNLLYSLITLLVGLSVISFIKAGEINWVEIGILLGFAFLILFFMLGVSLYKKER